MPKMVEVGQQFGHLTVVGHEGDKVKLRCTCGAVVRWRVSKFLSGKYKSCGHLGKELFRNYPNAMRNDSEGEGENE